MKIFGYRRIKTHSFTPNHFLRTTHILLKYKLVTFVSLILRRRRRKAKHLYVFDLWQHLNVEIITPLGISRPQKWMCTLVLGKYCYPHNVWNEWALVHEKYGHFEWECIGLFGFGKKRCMCDWLRMINEHIWCCKHAASGCTFAGTILESTFYSKPYIWLNLKMDELQCVHSNLKFRPHHKASRATIPLSVVTTNSFLL